MEYAVDTDMLPKIYDLTKSLVACVIGYYVLKRLIISSRKRFLRRLGHW